MSSTTTTATHCRGTKRDGKPCWSPAKYLNEDGYCEHHRDQKKPREMQASFSSSSSSFSSPVVSSTSSPVPRPPGADDDDDERGVVPRERSSTSNQQRHSHGSSTSMTIPPLVDESKMSRLTQEQKDVVALIRRYTSAPAAGGDAEQKQTKQVFVSARAGAGKTSTLEMCAYAAVAQGCRCEYLVFNRLAKEEARKKWGRLLGFCDIRTLDGFALHLATTHGIVSGYSDEKKKSVLPIDPSTGDTVQNLLYFLYSDADDLPTVDDNMPDEVRKFFDELHKLFKQALREIDEHNTDFDLLSFAVCHQLKILIANKKQQQEEHSVEEEAPLCIFVDEAQDLTPRKVQMLRRYIQLRGNVRCIVFVGDPLQRIYGFRGASQNLVDNLLNESDNVLSLSTTFRFGPTIAAVANTVASQVSFTKKNNMLVRTQNPYPHEDAPVHASPGFISELPKHCVFISRTRRHMVLKAWNCFLRAPNDRAVFELPASGGTNLSNIRAMLETWKGIPELFRFATLRDFLAAAKMTSSDVVAKSASFDTGEVVPDDATTASADATAAATSTTDDDEDESNVKLVLRLLRMIRGQTKRWWEKQQQQEQQTQQQQQQQQQNPRQQQQREEEEAKIASCFRYKLCQLVEALKSVKEKTPDQCEAPSRNDSRKRAQQKAAGNIWLQSEKEFIILTTCHRCKGLEWPAVVLADDFLDCLERVAKRDEKRKEEEEQEYDNSKNELDEELLVLYVAATRAMDELFVPWWLRVDTAKYLLSKQQATSSSSPASAKPEFKPSMAIKFYDDGNTPSVRHSLSLAVDAPSGTPVFTFPTKLRGDASSTTKNSGGRAMSPSEQRFADLCETGNVYEQRVCDRVKAIGNINSLQQLFALGNDDGCYYAKGFSLNPNELLRGEQLMEKFCRSIGVDDPKTVNFSNSVIPDILQLEKKGSSIELTVCEIKNSAQAKLYHKRQVLFYHMLIKCVLDNGEKESNIVSMADPQVWFNKLRDMAAPEEREIIRADSARDILKPMFEAFCYPGSLTGGFLYSSTK